eukprot:CAMPEP_0172323334 /NCGR_PEP_ID=MMETSP1058-20130122/48462_1 /TAXON_ID=83371 /ORGANISM="Detonula confervacea, Strain CCMP 353" /LENGTH=624 /DNA_ID=CAMNT_0013039305 /DNA_START=156 /DNA_END=2030 /DNA_ORIENTATION=+
MLHSNAGQVHSDAMSDARLRYKSGMAFGALGRALSIRAGSGSQPESSANKKYSQAASAAMKTISSFASKTHQPNIPNLLSESALMDKETNAIYWQGGAEIFSSSLTKPYLTQRGVLHVKATILTVALWLWVWGHVSRYLASRYFESNGGIVQGHKLLFNLPFISPEDAPPFLRKIATVVTPIIQFVLLLLHSLLYLRLPQYSTKVLAATVLLYLLESYSCSTRRYLSHALNAPAEVESYLEQIRSVEPSVTWKVRCFHYEDREFWKNCMGTRKMWESWMRKNDEEGVVGTSSAGRSKSTNANPKPASYSSAETFVESPALFRRKVVTHQAVATYKFGSWEDHTLASLWKRSQSFSSTSQEAPFSKLTLSKLLVLQDKNTREDYFAQQAAFVMLEGRKDIHAEFATTIEVEGFRPKLLAVRPVRRASNISAALFRQHIYVLFTLLGLSLPYRIWFAKHCDEIRVAVVKETSNAESSTKEGEMDEGKASWFRGKWGRGSSLSSAAIDSKRAQELFRRSMQQFSLYGEDAPQIVAGQAVNLAEDDVLISESVLDSREGAPSEQNNDNIDQDEVTASETTTSIDKDSSLDSMKIGKTIDTTPPDSPPVSSLSTQPPPESLTSLNQDAQ